MYGGTNGKAEYEVVAVATQSDRETVKAFAQEFKMNFPILPDAGSQVTSLYHILPILATFFIDREGIIRYIQASIVDGPTMEKWLLDKQ